MAKQILPQDNNKQIKKSSKKERFVSDANWQWCHRDAAGEIIKYSDPMYCSYRPTPHCWHLSEERDALVCCYCHHEAMLPARSCLVPHDFYSGFHQIINRHSRDGIQGFFQGKIVKILSRPYISERFTTRADDAIKVTDPKSHIRTIFLYSSGNSMDGNQRMAEVLNDYGIVRANIEAFKKGKIPRDYRTQALKEIENQMSYFPKTEIITAKKEKKNALTETLLKQVKDLKRSQGK